MVVFALSYSAVALLGIIVTRLVDGPWRRTSDFMLDVLFFMVWPLSLGLLAFAFLCGRIVAGPDRRRCDDD